ncbi:unnamed protein product [Anisakis simplex]|uniref:Uncharacterized protein n=1 Tax=Anisakis simplex TaxID=6269 RepID=A0A0M3JMA1_ANISI|nr:unnamed protein product [Anisakis simplex]
MATTSAGDNSLDKKSSPTATRPDLAAVANERCELMTQDRQQHQQIDGKHRNAEAIVVSYFDDVMVGFCNLFYYPL